MSSGSDASAGQIYLATLERRLARLAADEWAHIRSAAEVVADAVGSGHTLHVFGTGHSHMLAEELYYRAGGLVGVRPILFEGLMLHASAELSTTLERLPGLASAILRNHPIGAGDVVIVASNSGGNTVVTELVDVVHQSGGLVIAVTSLRHARSEAARSTGGRRLHELADVVVDNGGDVGDAVVAIEGLDKRVAPTSTVLGAAVLNAMVAEAIQILVESGHPPDVYASSNALGGDAANSAFSDVAGERRR